MSGRGIKKQENEERTGVNMLIGEDMLKEVIANIVKAENEAEKLEKVAKCLAEELLKQAEEKAAKLRSVPSEEAEQQAREIIKEAEERAEIMERESLAEVENTSVDSAAIERATDMIVAEFLKS